MLRNKLIAVYNAVINGLSFYRGLYKMHRWLNRSIDRPESIETMPDSHPRGFIKKFRKRRISIVESYIKIISSLESDKYHERLDALRLLTRHILYSRSLDMPLNTARVQMALMKQAVKYRDNKRIQLERLMDFSISSYGKSKSIRKYLKELDIIEVPETGQPLQDLPMGWDSHVHDNLSYGRKTPTQLVVDAFIKGISRLTVVYNSLSHPEIIPEVIEAGHILGIHVNIGLEFHVGESDNRFHYIYLFPHFENESQLKNYLEAGKEELQVFWQGVEEARKNRVLAINDAIQFFNIEHLPIINSVFVKGSIYYLEKLTLQDMSAIIPLKHATPMHLGELLYTKYRPVLFSRVLLLKAQNQWSESQCKEYRLSPWESHNTRKKYEAIREEFRELNPETLRLKYFAHPRAAFELPTVFQSLKEAFQPTEPGSRECQYRPHLKLIHPLKHGLARAVEVILENYPYIGHAEIYNMHDSYYRNHDELESFAAFLDLVNRGEVGQLEDFLRDHHIEVEETRLKECAAFCRQNPIQPACGSDSTGRTGFIPGMGFIFRRDLVEQQDPDFLKEHYSLPAFVSRLISASGGPAARAPYEGDSFREKVSGLPKAFGNKHYQKFLGVSGPFFKKVLTRRRQASSQGDGNEIINLGKSKETPPNEIGDENQVQPISLKRAWRYINPVIKDLVYIAIGFIPAYLTLGWEYASIWFGITLVRNAVTDIISGRGYQPKEWQVKNIDFTFLSHSLFWTGFSVPLLGLVKTLFDRWYPFVPGGIGFEMAKFFFVCIANGTYLAAHNTLRGFDKSIIRVNFFRSLLAWPFAGIFSSVGNLLGVPSIVQAKFWSDFVAGLIEGSGKLNRRIDLGKRDISVLLPNIRSDNPGTRYIATLDLLYFFREDPRARNSLKIILFKRRTSWQGFLELIRLRKRPSAGDFPEYHHLCKWFSEATHFFRLIDFILAHYKKEAAIYLTDLVSETFEEFREWLIKIEPHGISE